MQEFYKNQIVSNNMIKFVEDNSQQLLDTSNNYQKFIDVGRSESLLMDSIEGASRSPLSDPKKSIDTLK